MHCWHLYTVHLIFVFRGMTYALIIVCILFCKRPMTFSYSQSPNPNTIYLQKMELEVKIRKRVLFIQTPNFKSSYSFLMTLLTFWQVISICNISVQIPVLCRQLKTTKQGKQSLGIIEKQVCFKDRKFTYFV